MIFKAKIRGLGLATASPWPWPRGKVLGLRRPVLAQIVKAINLTNTIFFLPKSTNFLSLSLLSAWELVVASNAVSNNRGQLLTIHVRIMKAKKLHTDECYVWIISVITGRMARSGNGNTVLNLLTGQKSGFSPSNSDGHVDPLSCAKFHLNRHRGWECGPKNIKNFHFSVMSRPARATPLTDFENF